MTLHSADARRARANRCASYPCRRCAVAARRTARRRLRSVPLTLDEAIAQGLANSRRLAELDARDEAAAFAVAASARPPIARSSRRRRLHAHEPRRRVRDRAARAAAAGRLSRHSRQLSARGSICSGRSTPAAATDALERAARGRAQRQSARTSTPRAPTCASRSRARSGRSSRRGKPKRCLQRSLEADRRPRQRPARAARARV